MASLVAQASSSALALNSRAVASPQSKLALGSASRVACLPRPLVARGLSRSSTLVVPRAVAVEADSKVGRLGSEIKTLTLEEARLLVDYLQEVLGVSPTAFAPAAAVAAPAAGAEAAPAVEEKTEFDLVLEEVPSASRIAVIKVIRTITSLGLKEAKDLIDGLPKPIKEAVGKDEAEDAKKQLEGAGAKCSVK